MMIDRLKGLVPAPVKAGLKAGLYARNLAQRMVALEHAQEKVSLLIGTPLHANLGDHLITMAALRYLMDVGYKTRVVEVPTEMYRMFRARLSRLACVDAVFINGGGWMGNLWVPEELLVQQIVRDFAEKRVVILPQTVYFDEGIRPCASLIDSANRAFAGCRDVTLCVRENNSYRFAARRYAHVRVVLVPDMALSFYRYAPKNRHQPGKRIGLCLRNDCERYETEERKSRIIRSLVRKGYRVEPVDTMHAGRVHPEDRERTVMKRLEWFADCDFVVTDRLHGMIFSYLCDTPCIALDNRTHKVSGVYHTWLRDSARIFPAFAQPEEGIEGFVASELRAEENVCTLDRFDALRKIVVYGED